MTSVRLTFTAPSEDNVVALRVYEAADRHGPFTQIERITEVGTYPGYITEYTTELAASQLDWFALAWEDSDGDVGPMSGSVKPGDTSLVGQIVGRVLQRDPSIDGLTATQEAEAAVQQFYGESTYPYTAKVPGYRRLNGLVYLVMARCYAFQVAVESETVAIGLVKLQQGSAPEAAINALIDLANDALGWNTSVVLQMEDIRHRHQLPREVFVA